MRKKIKKWLIPLFFLSLLLSACARTEDPDIDAANTNKAQIVTSIFPVYEIIRELAGNQADVHLMVGSGEDPHHYEPSAKAINLVNQADAFIYIDDEMEFWASDMLKVIENEDLAILPLSDGLDLNIEESHEEDEETNEDEHGHSHGDIDPHYWLDPLAVSKQIPEIVKILSEIDTEGKAIYEKNGQEFIYRLEKLDEDYKESFAEADKRTFVVQHKAFGHLAKRYDLEQLSAGGLSTEVEPNPKDLIETIKFVRENDTEVIFYQSGNTSAIAETIAKEANAEISILYDIGNKPQGIEESDNYYIDAMYHNLEELKKVIY